MQGTFATEASALCEAIAGRIGQQKFKVWFGRSAKMHLSEERLTIAVPSEFMAQWIKSHFASEIDEALRSVTGRHVPFVMQVEPETVGASAVRTAEKAERVAGMKTPAKLVSPLQQQRKGPRLKLTLQDFVVGRSNELAFNAARSVINSDSSPFNPLFIHGGYGVGKTHLLQGICNELAAARPGARIMYLAAEEFMNQFVLALKTRKLEEFRSRFRNLDLLAIDDIHFIANKNSMQSEFLYTFNSIDLAGKQIVLASDAHPKQIGQISESLVSRFVSGMVVKIESPDFETRLEICRRIAARLGKNIDEDVLRYVAEHVRTNVRELEGAILKLVAFASLGCERISRDMAGRLLADHVTRTDPLVHVSDIEGAVAGFFGISPGDVHSSKKNRTVAIARNFCMYLARNLTKMSFPEIGRCLGNKNHATVLMACRKIDELLAADKDVRWTGPSGNRVLKARMVLSQIQEGLSR